MTLPPPPLGDRPLTLRRHDSLEPHARTQLQSLRIDLQQLEYAGPIERALARCDEGPPEAIAGLAICLGDTVVGFVVLQRGLRCPPWAPAGAVALTAMRLDLDWQGQGLGPRALRAVDDWLRRHWPDPTVVALSVDEQNHAGRAAYRKAGFRDHGLPLAGRIGPVRVMVKPLAPATANNRNPSPAD